MMIRATMLLLSAVLLVAVVAGCSDSGNRPITGDRLTDTLLNVNTLQLVNFSIAGTAACNQCTSDQQATPGPLIIEVTSAADPLDVVGSGVFEGVGSFSLSGLRATKGSTLNVNGTLHIGATGTMSQTAKIAVPGHDNDTISVTLNFPSTGSPQ